jgi:hypothetical protein
MQYGEYQGLYTGQCLVFGKLYIIESFQWKKIAKWGNWKLKAFSGKNTNGEYSGCILDPIFASYTVFDSSSSILILHKLSSVIFTLQGEYVD